MLAWKFFSGRPCTSNFAGCFSATMEMLPAKTQEFGLKKATGLRKGAAEGVFLFSDGLDSPRVSN